MSVGVDPRLHEAARELIAAEYGEAASATNLTDLLAERLQGAYEDWSEEAAEYAASPKKQSGEPSR